MPYVAGKTTENMNESDKESDMSSNFKEFHMVQ